MTTNDRNRALDAAYRAAELAISTQITACCPCMRAESGAGCMRRRRPRARARRRRLHGRRGSGERDDGSGDDGGGDPPPRFSCAADGGGAS